MEAKFYFRFCVNILLCCLTGCFTACKKDPSAPQSPQQEIESFVLADNDLQIELVASEPLVQDPVAISFDGAGRLWVVEMRGFMPDINGQGEEDPVGRISVLFDEDGDGQMDKSQIFADSLVLPRAIAIVKGGALVAENVPLWFMEDSDGDFVADTKTLIDSSYGTRGLVEHSPNGLWRGMDNWLYNVKSEYRYKKIKGEWVKDKTEFRGQWGVSHDNAGRLFYNYNWSQLHADLVPPGALQKNIHHSPTSGIDHGLTLERTIYPIRENPAVNRGYVPGTFDERGRLLEFTAACSPFIYRGSSLPSSYFGDAFVCEPAANLIKQDNIIEDGFMLLAEGVYKNKEFLASTDERFRPVALASGPNGNLYVADMYRGIIQDGIYMTPYLREVSVNRKLVQPIHMGRIWRISQKGKKAENTPDLSKLDIPALVELLGNDNGWTRDNAQRLLVEKEQLSTSLPYLEIQISKGNPLGQLHALWTLEGLGNSDPKIYLNALYAKDDKVAQAALRLLVELVPEHPRLKNEIQQFVDEQYMNASPLLRMQMVLVSHEIPSQDAFQLIQKFLHSYGSFPVARDVIMSSLQDREADLMRVLLADKEWKTDDQNKEIFLEMLATSITRTGSLKEITNLLNYLTTIKDVDHQWINRALAQGMIGAKAANDSLEIRLASKPRVFTDPNFLGEGSEGLAANLEQLFTWPGKPKKPKKENSEVHEVDPKRYALGRQLFLNVCSSCHSTQGEGIKRFAPPLRQSEWVNGDANKLVMILLHGMEGPVTVNRKTYDIPDILPSMPSFTTLKDSEIASILTYIRNAWGNSQPQVDGSLVGSIRFHTQGQITPWKASELDTLKFKFKINE